MIFDILELVIKSFVAIYIIEKAYKEDDGVKAIDGIEVLVLATAVLSLEYITNRFKFQFNSYSSTVSYIFAIYFVLKSIVIYTKGRKEVEKSLSDIEEIVKKEEPIKKEATKKRKEKVEEIENKEKNKQENKTTKRKTKKEVKSND